MEVPCNRSMARQDVIPHRKLAARVWRGQKTFFASLLASQGEFVPPVSRHNAPPTICVHGEALQTVPVFERYVHAGVATGSRPGCLDRRRWNSIRESARRNLVS